MSNVKYGHRRASYVYVSFAYLSCTSSEHSLYHDLVVSQSLLRRYLRAGETQKSGLGELTHVGRDKKKSLLLGVL